MKKLIGAHLSISKGIYTIQEQMNALNSKSCAIFLKSQKKYQSPVLQPDAIKRFQAAVIQPELILPHGSYLINFANPDLHDKSMDCLLDDLERCRALGVKLYNIHPGSDVKKLGKTCIKLIGAALNKALDAVPGVIIVLENMAGQGNTLGSTFEEIRDIIEQIVDKNRIGVCLDTCHLFGAGFDIRTKEGFESVMVKFDQIIGLKYLKAMHLNDSKEPLGSKKDRHESIGKGLIGLDAFKFVMNSSYFDDMPLILETPDTSKYKEEIDLLISLIEAKETTETY